MSELKKITLEFEDKTIEYYVKAAGEIDETVSPCGPTFCPEQTFELRFHIFAERIFLDKENSEEKEFDAKEYVEQLMSLLKQK